MPNHYYIPSPFDVSQELQRLETRLARLENQTWRLDDNRAAFEYNIYSRQYLCQYQPVLQNYGDEPPSSLTSAEPPPQQIREPDPFSQPEIRREEVKWRKELTALKANTLWDSLVNDDEEF